MSVPSTAILLAHGPLRQGISAELTSFVYARGGAITGHDQYVDPDRARYFTRLAWTPKAPLDRDAVRRDVAEVIGRLGLEADVYFADDTPRIALFVSSLPHCLYDILGRWRSGEWRVEIPLVISNHDELAEAARRFDADFQHVPMDGDKAAAERRQLALLRERDVELVVLGRYMQIVGPQLIAAYPNRIINIHHAFLPAFPGAKPYHAAHRRGVKLIGATSHYVTAELDAGPIIEQDVIRVSHATSVDEMLRIGRDLERVVLARAVWLHLQRRVVVDEGRTVVFA